MSQEEIELIKCIEHGIEQCKMQDDMDSCSFGYENGVLITGNDGVFVLNAFKQLAAERKKNEELEKHIERIVFEFCEYSGIGKISGYYHKPFSSPPALTDRWKDFKIDKAKNLLK